MSDEQPTNPQQPDTILRSVTNVMRQTEAALSPWVRRWWQPGAAAWSGPVTDSAGGGAPDRSLPTTLRVQRTPSALVDQFSQNILQRHAESDRITRRYRREEAVAAASPVSAAATLPLPGVGSGDETVQRAPGELTLEELAASFQPALGSMASGESDVQRTVDPTLGSMAPAPERFADMQEMVRRAAQRRTTDAGAPAGTPPPVQRTADAPEESGGEGANRSIAAQIEARIRAARAQREAARGAGTPQSSSPSTPQSTSAPTSQPTPPPTPPRPPMQPGGTVGRAYVQRAPGERPLDAQPPSEQASTAQPSATPSQPPSTPGQATSMPESMPATVQRISGSGDERVQVPEELSETPTANPDDTGYSRTAALAERIRQARLQRAAQPPESAPPRPTLRTSTDPDNPRFSRTASIAERISEAREQRAQGEAPVQRQVSSQPGDPRYSRAAEMRERLAAQRAQRRAQSTGQPSSQPASSAPDQTTSQTADSAGSTGTQGPPDTVQRAPAEQSDASPEDGEPGLGTSETPSGELPSTDMPNNSIARAIEARLQAARAQRTAGQDSTTTSPSATPSATAPSTNAPESAVPPAVQRSPQPDVPENLVQDVTESRAEAIRRRIDAMRTRQQGHTPGTPSDTRPEGEAPSGVQRQKDPLPRDTPPGAGQTPPTVPSSPAQPDVDTDATPTTRPTIARDFKLVDDTTDVGRPRAFSRSQVLTPERKTGDFTAGDPKAKDTAPGSVQRSPASPSAAPGSTSSAQTPPPPRPSSAPSAPTVASDSPTAAPPQSVQRAPESAATQADADTSVGGGGIADSIQRMAQTGSDAPPPVVPAVQRDVDMPAGDATGPSSPEHGGDQVLRSSETTSDSTTSSEMPTGDTLVPVQRVTAGPPSAPETNAPTPVDPAPESTSTTSDVQRAPLASMSEPAAESTASPDVKRDSATEAPIEESGSDAGESIQRQAEAPSAQRQPTTPQPGPGTAPSSGATETSEGPVDVGPTPPSPSVQPMREDVPASDLSVTSVESAAQPETPRLQRASTTAGSADSGERASAPASASPSGTGDSGETVQRQAETPSARAPESEEPPAVQRDLAGETDMADTAASVTSSPEAPVRTEPSTGPSQIQRAEVELQSSPPGPQPIQRQSVPAPDSAAAASSSPSPSVARTPPADVQRAAAVDAPQPSTPPSEAVDRPTGRVQRAVDVAGDTPDTSISDAPSTAITPSDTSGAVQRDESDRQPSPPTVQRDVDRTAAQSAAQPVEQTTPPETPAAVQGDRPPVQRQTASDEAEAPSATETSQPTAQRATPAPSPSVGDTTGTPTEPRSARVQRQREGERPTPSQPATDTTARATSATETPGTSSVESVQRQVDTTTSPPSPRPSSAQSLPSQQRSEQPPSVQRSSTPSSSPQQSSPASPVTGVGETGVQREPDAELQRQPATQPPPSQPSTGASSGPPTSVEDTVTTAPETVQRAVEQSAAPPTRMDASQVATDAPKDVQRQTTSPVPLDRGQTGGATGAASTVARTADRATMPPTPGTATDAPAVQRASMPTPSVARSSLPLVQRRQPGPILSRTPSPAVLPQAQTQVERVSRTMAQALRAPATAPMSSPLAAMPTALYSATAGVQRVLDPTQTASMDVPPAAPSPASTRRSTQKSMPLAAQRKPSAKRDTVQRAPTEAAAPRSRTKTASTRQTHDIQRTASLPVQRSPQNLIQRGRVSDLVDKFENLGEVESDEPPTESDDMESADEAKQELGGPDLDVLARALLPIIKRMLVIERERRPLR